MTARFEWGECAWTARDLLKTRITPKLFEDLAEAELERLPVIVTDPTRARLH